jgi:hypothetical protein
VEISGAIVADHSAQIGAQCGNRNVVADVQSGELFGEIVAIGVRQHPLGEIVGKALGEKMMAAQGLKGVVEN